jgi:hypothetical protein
MTEKKCCGNCGRFEPSYGGIVVFDPPIVGLCDWEGPMPRWLRVPRAEVMVSVGDGGDCETWVKREDDNG